MSAEQRRALLTGGTGQDGSYLTRLLLDKGYTVFLFVRRLSNPNYTRIADILHRVTLIDGDLIDQGSFHRAIEISQPHEVYHLGGQSHVGLSYTQPVATAEYTGLATLRLLEAIRLSGLPNIRLFNAASSEMFGDTETHPQNERTPFTPKSPYASAKLFGFNCVKNYRESYGLFGASGIMFNHESPVRGIDFVTRKISNAVARIKMGLQDRLVLGNIRSYRDWHYAGDTVRGMWLMLQHHTPDDFVMASGESHTIADFLDVAFDFAELKGWANYVDFDDKLRRPNDVHYLIGDRSKIQATLGWQPTVTFTELVQMMVRADLERIGLHAYQPTSHHPASSNRMASSGPL